MRSRSIKISFALAFLFVLALTLSLTPVRSQESGDWENVYENENTWGFSSPDGEYLIPANPINSSTKTRVFVKCGAKDRFHFVEVLHNGVVAFRVSCSRWDDSNNCADPDVGGVYYQSDGGGYAQWGDSYSGLCTPYYGEKSDYSGTLVCYGTGLGDGVSEMPALPPSGCKTFTHEFSSGDVRLRLRPDPRAATDLTWGLSFPLPFGLGFGIGDRYESTLNTHIRVERWNPDAPPAPPNCYERNVNSSEALSRAPGVWDGGTATFCSQQGWAYISKIGGIPVDKMYLPVCPDTETIYDPGQLPLEIQVDAGQSDVVVECPVIPTPTPTETPVPTLTNTPTATPVDPVGDDCYILRSQVRTVAPNHPLGGDVHTVAFDDWSGSADYPKSYPFVHPLPAGHGWGHQAVPCAANHGSSTTDNLIFSRFFWDSTNWNQSWFRVRSGQINLLFNNYRWGASQQRCGASSSSSTSDLPKDFDDGWWHPFCKGAFCSKPVYASTEPFTLEVCPPAIAGTPVPSVTPTNTPTATPTITPTGTITPTNTPTQTPWPTVTSTPTFTPQPPTPTADLDCALWTRYNVPVFPNTFWLTMTEGVKFRIGGSTGANVYFRFPTGSFGVTPGTRVWNWSTGGYELFAPAPGVLLDLCRSPQEPVQTPVPGTEVPPGSTITPMPPGTPTIMPPGSTITPIAPTPAPGDTVTPTPTGTPTVEAGSTITPLPDGTPSVMPPDSTVTNTPTGTPTVPAGSTITPIPTYATLTPTPPFVLIGTGDGDTCDVCSWLERIHQAIIYNLMVNVEILNQLAITQTEQLDAPVVVGFEARYYQIMENAGDVALVVSLDRPAPAGGVTVHLRTVDGSAIAMAPVHGLAQIAPPDYTAITDQLVLIAEGQVSAVVPLSVTDDDLVEPDEMLWIELFDPLGAVLDNPEVPVVIHDDDTFNPATVSFGAPHYTVTEGDSVTIDLLADFPDDTELNAWIDAVVESLNGSASADDYAYVSETIRLTPPVPVGSIIFDTIDDTIPEDTETVAITLRDVIGGEADIPGVIVSILDNEIEGVPTPEPGYTLPASCTEQLVTAPFSLIKIDQLSDVRVISGGVAASVRPPGLCSGLAGDELRNCIWCNPALLWPDPPVPASCMWPATYLMTPNPIEGAGAGFMLDSEVRLELCPIDPDQTEPASPGVIAGTEAVSVTWSASSYQYLESSGSAVLTVTLSTPAPAPVTIDYTTASGSALAGQHFGYSSGTLAFNTGDLTRTFAIPLYDDFNDNADRSFTVHLSDPFGVGLADEHLVTDIHVQDDDFKPFPTAYCDTYEVDIGEDLIFTKNNNPYSNQGIYIWAEPANVTGTKTDVELITPRRAAGRNSFSWNIPFAGYDEYTGDLIDGEYVQLFVPSMLHLMNTSSSRLALVHICPEENEFPIDDPWAGCERRSFIVSDTLTISPTTDIPMVHLYHEPDTDPVYLDWTLGGLDVSPNTLLPDQEFTRVGQNNMLAIMPGLSVPLDQRYLDAVIHLSSPGEGVYWVCYDHEQQRVAHSATAVDYPATAVAIVGEKEPFKSTGAVIGLAQTTVALADSHVQAVGDGSSCKVLATDMFSSPWGMDSYEPAPWTDPEYTHEVSETIEGEVGDLIVGGLPVAICNSFGMAWPVLRIVRLLMVPLVLFGLGRYLIGLVRRVRGLR